MNFSLQLVTTKTNSAACWVEAYYLKHYVLVVDFTDIVAVVASRVTLLD